MSTEAVPTEFELETATMLAIYQQRKKHQDWEAGELVKHSDEAQIRILQAVDGRVRIDKGVAPRGPRRKEKPVIEVKSTAARKAANAS